MLPSVAICLGSTGPLFGGYMLAGGYSWRLFFYVEIAFAFALFIAAFIFVEETLYDRVLPAPSTTTSTSESKKGETVRYTEYETVIPERKSLLEQLKPWGAVRKNTGYWATTWRPFTLFFVPAVFWVIVTYGKPVKPLTCRSI